MVDTKISDLAAATCNTSMEFAVADGTTANNKVNLGTIQGAQTKDGDVTITGITTLQDKLRVEATAAGDAMIEFRHVDGGAGVDASIASRGADDVLVISNAQTQNIINVVAGTTVSTLTPTGDLTITGEAECSTFKMTTGAASGYVLKSDAAGAASWGPDTAGTGEFIDARVGPTEAFTTLGAAIAGGHSNIYVAANTTEAANVTLTKNIEVWLAPNVTVTFGDYVIDLSGYEWESHQGGGLATGYYFTPTTAKTCIVNGTMSGSLTLDNSSAVTGAKLTETTASNAVTFNCDYLQVNGGDAADTGCALADYSTVDRLLFTSGTLAPSTLGLIIGNFVQIDQLLVTVGPLDLTAGYTISILGGCSIGSIIQTLGAKSYKVSLAGCTINAWDTNGGDVEIDVVADSCFIHNGYFTANSSIDIGSSKYGLLNNFTGGQVNFSDAGATGWQVTNCRLSQSLLTISGNLHKFVNNTLLANITVAGDKNHFVANQIDSDAGGSAYVLTINASANNTIVTNNQLANAIVDNGTNTVYSNNNLHGTGPTPGDAINFIDARVGAGETYTTLGAAITAGKTNIYVVSDVTEVANSTLTADTTIWASAAINFGDYQLISASKILTLHCSADGIFNCDRTTAGYSFDLVAIEGTVAQFGNATTVNDCPLFNSATPPLVNVDVFTLEVAGATNTGATIGDQSTISQLLVAAESGAYRFLELGANFQGAGSVIGAIVLTNGGTSLADTSVNINSGCTINSYYSGPFDYKITLGGTINKLDSNGNRIDVTFNEHSAKLQNAIIDSSSLIDIDTYTYGVLNNVYGGQLVNSSASSEGWKISNCTFQQTSLDIYGNHFNFSGNRIESNIQVYGNKNHLVDNTFDTTTGGSAFVVTVQAGATNTIVTNNQIANAVVDNGTNTLVSNNSIHGAGPTPSSGIEFVDARVGPGETYTTLASAVTAGKTNIYVVGATTEVADITITQNTTVWLGEAVNIANTLITGSAILTIYGFGTDGVLVLNRTVAGHTIETPAIEGTDIIINNTSTTPGCTITDGTTPPLFVVDQLMCVFADTATNYLATAADSVINQLRVETFGNTNTTTVITLGVNNYIGNLSWQLTSDLLTHYALMVPATSIINTIQSSGFGFKMQLGGTIHNIHANTKRVDVNFNADHASISNAILDPASVFRTVSSLDNVCISNIHNINLDLTTAGAIGWNITGCTISSMAGNVAGNLHKFTNNRILTNVTVDGAKNHFVNNQIDSDAGGAAYVLTVGASATSTIITNNQLANAIVDNGTNTVYENNNLHGVGPHPVSSPFYDAVVGPTGGGFKYTTVDTAIAAGAKRILVLGITGAVIETKIVDLTGSVYIMVIGEWRLNTYQIDMKSLTNIGLVIEGLGIEQSTILYAQSTTSIPMLANTSATNTNFSLRNITFDNTGTSANDCNIVVSTASSAFENIRIKLPNFSNCGINLQGAGGLPTCNNLHIVGGGINCSLALQPGGQGMEVNNVYLTGSWPINITATQLDAGGAIIGVDTSPGLLHSINNLCINADNATSDTDMLPFVVSSAKNWFCTQGSLMLGGVGQEGKIEAITSSYFGFVEYLQMMNGRQMAFENIRHFDYSISSTHPVPADVQFTNITSCSFRNTAKSGQNFAGSDLNVIDCVFKMGAITQGSSSNVNISNCNFTGTTTTVSTAALSGATTIDLTATWGLPLGSGFRIKLTSGLVDVVTISNIVGNTVTFAPGLSGPAAIGNEAGYVGGLDAAALNSRITDNNISGAIAGTANHHSICGNFVGCNEHLSTSSDGITMGGTYGIKCNNRTRGTVTGGTLGVTANNVENII